MGDGRRAFIAALLVGAAWVITGCWQDTQTEGEDLAIAEQASTSVEVSADVAYVIHYFKVSATTEEDAVTEARAAIALDVDRPDCVSFVTDGLTYLDTTFSECLVSEGRLLLDGTLHAKVSSEPSGLTYDVTTTDMTVGPAEVTGSWQVRHPFDPSIPSAWSSETQVTGPVQSVSMSSSASWTTDGECVAMSMQANLQRALGTTRMTTTDVTRCVGECPTGGMVEVTPASRATLSWTYDGNGRATVTTGQGQTFHIALLCSY